MVLTGHFSYVGVALSSTNDIRISTTESKMTFISDRLDGVLSEIDMRQTGYGMFVKFIRVGGLISRTEFYRNPDKTNLALTRDYDRVSGAIGNALLVSQVVSTFYELDGVTVDSIVSGFLERDLTVSAEDSIICCSGYFDTSENDGCD